jgi:hypothetical protein
MTTEDTTGSTESTPPKRSRGIWAIGSDVGIPNFSFQLGPDGVPSVEAAGSMSVSVRTDMWRFWLRGAIDAAAVAADVAGHIPLMLERVEAGAATYAVDLADLAIRELIASMQAITASAFAIDGFYATVKYRSPPHPDQAKWDDNETARYKQITETFFYHLRIGDQKVKKQIRTWVSELYEFRDAAVHPPSKHREFVYRPDLNASVDPSFDTFRRKNAVEAPAKAIVILDYLVSYLGKGSDELAQQKPGARRFMDELFDQYEAAEGLPAVARHEPKG